MALLSILQYPDERLRNKALPVLTVNAEVRTIVDNMLETMYEHGGIGLASIQVGVQQRIIVVDISDNKKSPICVINPEIIEREGIQYEYEGCLSLPGVCDKVKRVAKIRLKALDREGKPYEIDADGELSICIQHEMDHLEGVLFIDHLSRLKKERVHKKFEKLRRQAS